MQSSWSFLVSIMETNKFLLYLFTYVVLLMEVNFLRDLAY